MKKNLIQSVERALDILEMLRSSEKPLRSVDIADGLGVNSNTASNLVRTLYSRDYLVQDEDRRYRLGPRCLDLAEESDRWGDLREKALPLMRELAESSGHLTFLGVLDAFSLVGLEMVQGGGAIAISPKQAWLNKAHCSAAGKVLLAYLPESDLKRFFKTEDLKEFTTQTITDKEVLRQELADIMKNGFASCKDETSADVATVGVPVFNSKGQCVAALSQAFPSYFIESKRLNFKKQAKELAKFAKRIS